MTLMRNGTEDKCGERYGKPGTKDMGGWGAASAGCHQDSRLHRSFRIARAKSREPVSRNKHQNMIKGQQNRSVGKGYCHTNMVSEFDSYSPQYKDELNIRTTAFPALDKLHTHTRVSLSRDVLYNYYMMVW